MSKSVLPHTTKEALKKFIELLPELDLEDMTAESNDGLYMMIDGSQVEFIYMDPKTDDEDCSIFQFSFKKVG